MTPASPESPPLNVTSIERPTATNHGHQDKRPPKATEESVAAPDICCRRKKHRCGAQKAAATAAEHLVLLEFIKVINLDRLIENLNTIWIGRFHLFANPVRFERPKKPNISPHNNAAATFRYSRGVDQAKGQFQTGSYVNVVNGSSLVGVHGPSISSASVLVLDDSCVAERDLSNHVMGNVKDVNSISNLRTLIMEEGFSVVNLVYLGGLWVMIECDNVETKANMLQHTRVKSWFHVLQNDVHDFVSDERIVWVDIEGIPLNVWSRETFTRIGKNWEVALDIEDNVDSSFGRKRLCIKAKLPLSILESFKEMKYNSDEDSDVEPQKVPDRSQFCEEGPNDDKVSDVEEVSETNFGDNLSIPINHIDELEKQQSKDLFNIYRLLRKQPRDESHEVSSSLSHPPGFTLDVSVIRNENGQSAKEITVVVNAKVMNNSQDVYKEASCDNVDPNVVKKGGSVLGVMDDMIRVGKAMGYSMDGCVKHLEQIIGTQGVGDVSRKRLLWDYVSTLIDRWNGEVVVLGDFNEFRNIDERRGSCFNPTSARVFVQFISASGLVDVKMEGYTFTWSHPSGSKMSKLDWFLVSEGIFSIFQYITAVCLDRHLSDHCPIILCEVQADFGLIPFWIYHSWISLEGFDAMVEQTWRSFSHNDANKMIRLKKKIQDPKVRIRAWIKDKRSSVSGEKDSIKKELKRRVSRDEIQLAVWNCGENKSPGPDGYSFEFFRKYWNLVGSDLYAKFVNDFRPISLIGSVYKVVMKVLANRLALAFGFGNIWCKWILGTFSSAKASVLSQVLGVGVPSSIVMQAALSIGCGILHKQFRYLGVMVGECMSRHNAWASTVDKLRYRLSKWKVKTLSIGGRLTILKAVLGASPLYNMSIFKVPKGILNSMEAIRSKFFNGMEPSTNKITWAAWNKVLASKENWGLGVSSYHALNRALLFKWVDTCFWYDNWLGDKPLKDLFPRLFALELNKEVTVADKVQGVVLSSFRRPVRAGSKYQHLTDLNSLMESVSLSHSCHRWICDLSGDGEFRVKEVRNFLDNLFLPSYADATRWVKYIPIKINIFVWRARRDFLPTRVNLSRRGILLESSSCPLCLSSEENIHHVLFGCGLAESIFRRICRWWELD
uniref:RNA-directed DNA polymerase, eukaryota n=1 Tax=Tanacetum cinerariifolium TaxID=118510 RepID=A0A699GZY2_TANCI|nr:RNA-directed DNA polymerase, eukaryota [Tanacetum cinerariifolium]